MGLIIKDKFQQMITGYPTVSDKYDVAGGIFEGNTPAVFGDAVVAGSTVGYYQKAATVTANTTIAGFVVATNVKLAEDWPATTIQVNAGEAFNILMHGFIAVKLDASVTIADITANAPVCITATGNITGKTGSTGQTPTAFVIPNATFTGLYENQGTAAAPVYVAEIYVR